MNSSNGCSSYNTSVTNSVTKYILSSFKPGFQHFSNICTKVAKNIMDNIFFLNRTKYSCTNRQFVVFPTFDFVVQLLLTLLGQETMTLSFHPDLSSINAGSSSLMHPVSSTSWWTYIFKMVFQLRWFNVLDAILVCRLQYHLCFAMSGHTFACLDVSLCWLNIAAKINFVLLFPFLISPSCL